MEAAYHFGLGRGRSHGDRTPRPIYRRGVGLCREKPNDSPGKPSFSARKADGKPTISHCEAASRRAAIARIAGRQQQGTLPRKKGMAHARLMKRCECGLNQRRVIESVRGRRHRHLPSIPSADGRPFDDWRQHPGKGGRHTSRARTRVRRQSQAKSCSSFRPDFEKRCCSRKDTTASERAHLFYATDAPWAAGFPRYADFACPLFAAHRCFRAYLGRKNGGGEAPAPLGLCKALARQSLTLRVVSISASGWTER